MKTIERHGGSEIVRAQLMDETPSTVEDAQWLVNYVTGGSPQGDPILLSLGESWGGPPARLRAGLAAAPDHSHGYQLSEFGLPRLRLVLKEFLREDHRLADRDADRVRVAVSWSGTRAAMFDYGRLLIRQAQGDERIPVLLAPAPGWDYAGVFEPLGFETRFLEITPENGFRPKIEAIREIVSALATDETRRLALVVVNAQHNPSGVDWGAEIVGELLKSALDADGAVLIDDAHYWLRELGSSPTSALALAARLTRSYPQLSWLATRSLGKQFGCNGWALGALVAEPKVLDPLVQSIAAVRQYGFSGMQQWAMAGWLESDDLDVYRKQQLQAFATNRRFAISAFLNRFGYPPEAVYAGACGPFLLFGLPPAYLGLRGGTRNFRLQCFQATGVIFSDAWPLARATDYGGTLAYIRMFLGAPLPLLKDAFARMARAGFGYRMGGFTGTG